MESTRYYGSHASPNAPDSILFEGHNPEHNHFAHDDYLCRYWYFRVEKVWTAMH